MMRRPGLLLAAALLSGAPLAAQQEAVVEQLAGVMAAEDARDFQPALFSKALVAPDSVVRRLAATGAGRIGDQRATPLLLPVLGDPDSTVRVAAAFAVGLLGDTSAVPTLIDRLTGQPALDGPTALEAITALARIGGPRAGEFLRNVLTGSAVLTPADRGPLVYQALFEAWRLGPHAPVDAILPFTNDTSSSGRWRAAYSLGRLRAPRGGERLTVLLADREGYVRAVAARALTKQLADTAGLSSHTVAELLSRAAIDANPQVKVNALRSLADFRDSALSADVAPLIADPLPNVQVQAASTLGELGGSEAVRALKGVVAGKGTFAVRRTSLVSLARTDPTAFKTAAAPWRAATDWRQRAAAAEGEGIVGPEKTPWFLGDRDGRVVAAGLQSWSGEVPGPDTALIAAARPLLGHRDAGVRSVAADVVGRAESPGDIAALVQAYKRTAGDSFPDAALATLGALVAIRRSGAQAATQVDREFLAGTPRPTDYTIRRWAEENWPEAAARWGPAYPIATGRTPEDYREVIRRFVIAPDSLSRPHVKIETDQRGVIEIELLGPDAPLTVANFLRLAGRRFFDNNRWHRVVPNFVVQDGDPRGDGFGGPGGSPIRDEINRNRYDAPMLGMALSGPDTGNSQWFINLSPQPHLDGTYTVFGKVVNGTTVLPRITQGDVIRTIRQ
jgi:cyclophilin family peptidyl-prolyl cis-trans isomerase/HEAT repeat protein